MMNLKFLPPKKTIIRTLPDELKIKIFGELGECNEELLPWISLSLMHFSFINETRLQGNERRLLDILDSLAASFVHLMLFDLAHQDNQLNRMEDYANFTHTARQYTIMQHIFDYFSLEKYSLTGKGEKDLTSPTLKFSVARQFIGALLICYMYDSVMPLIKEAVRKVQFSSNDKDHKTMLQEYTQSINLGSPKYEIVEERGPNHLKEFVVEVSTNDGKSARANGGSKREASKNAAREYIIHFAPNLSSKKDVQKTNINSDHYMLPLNIHKNFVLALCEKFNANQIQAYYFSQSLIHPSFTNEHRIPKIIDYKKNAQLGAKAIEALLTLQIVFLSLKEQSEGSFTIERYRSLINNEDLSATCFDLLSLQKGVLLGKGAKKGLLDNPAAKTEFFQAVIGAAFKSHKHWNSFINNIPSDISELILGRISSVFEIKDIGDLEPTSGLNEILQAVKLDWNYEVSASGLEHQKSYKAILILTSNLTSEKLSIKSAVSGASKRLAIKHTAKIANKALMVINSDLGVSAKYEENLELKQFARFIFTHMLSLKISTADILRWKKMNLMGSNWLKQGKLTEFKLWAIAVGNIVQKNNLTNALRFFSSISMVSEQERLTYKTVITSIGKFIESLSPEAENKDITQSTNFVAIVKLAKIFKLLSQNWISTNLVRIAEDINLLRKERQPEIYFDSEIPAITISEKEGTYLTVFLYMLDFFEDSKVGLSKSKVHISFAFNQPKSALEISFSFIERFADKDFIQERLDSDILWAYLMKEANIYQINIDDSNIVLKTKIFSPDNSFASQALDAYKMENLVSKSENYMTSQLLHDLKNQLIAYQVSLESTGKDRTSNLKARYEASQHLDSAASIYYSLEIVSNSLVSPTLEILDIAEFIRLYIADKLSKIPLNIRLETPKTTGSSLIYSSKIFLSSIFENLIKNAVEAMPNGGEIRIDWICDNVSGVLMLDISDTGVGLSPEMLSKIKTGKVIDSSKHKGSGVGILSVQSMVEKLGGDCSISSELGKGTQWNITLPIGIKNIETDSENDDLELE